MTEVSPANFSPELVNLMRSALDAAVDRIDRSHRTPATKAKMAQRIVRTASEGVTDLNALTSAAVDEGACQRRDCPAPNATSASLVGGSCLWLQSETRYKVPASGSHAYSMIRSAMRVCDTTKNNT